MKFPYGKYINREVCEIFVENPNYIIWWYENIGIREIKDEIIRLVLQDFKDGNRDWDEIGNYDWDMFNGD